jgi:hypothetical protein
MTKKFNLSEAAAEILGANVGAKQKSGEKFGAGKSLNMAGVKAGTGIELNKEPHYTNSEALPDGTKGAPSATPPGATPPVGSEKDGVGITKAHGPEDHEGRADLAQDPEGSEDSYETIRDRKQGKKPTQTMHMNPGATFQQYEETENQDEGYITEEDFAYDASEDVDALLAGENLSEDFKSRAATIFEAAVTSRAMNIVEKIEVKMQEKFDEEVESIKEELAAKVDDYLNYMVQEWMTENAIAIEKGLRSEIVENFIDGLKDLFVEHYIDIPEEKVDIVEELADKVTELEEQINTEIAKNVELHKVVNEHKKVEAIYAVCEGLTQTQVEKIASLAEGVDFTTETEFTQKLEMIKESYFPSGVTVATSKQFLEESFVEDEPVEGQQKIADPEMAIYAGAISKTLKK